MNNRGRGSDRNQIELEIESVCNRLRLRIDIGRGSESSAIEEVRRKTFLEYVGDKRTDRSSYRKADWQLHRYCSHNLIKQFETLNWHEN